MNRLRADALLLLTAIIWGTAFVVQKGGGVVIGPIPFVGLRYLFSAIVIAPFAFWEIRRHNIPLTIRNFAPMILIGFCLFMGSNLQQIGLQSTSATNGGFLTALYIVLVPIAAWIVMRTKISPVVAAACLFSITGAYLLGAHGATHGWAFGDFLMLVADVFWSLHITLTAKFAQRVAHPFLLSCMQSLTVACCVPMVGFLFEIPTWHGIHEALPALLYASVFSSGIGFTLQIVSQRYTPASEAALIMSLESVFAALAGALWLHEKLTLLAAMGCLLILTGVIITELGPYWRGRKPLPIPSPAGAVPEEIPVSE